MSPRPDRQDFDTRVASLAHESTRKNKKNLQIIQRAALSAAQVTGDEHWDFFLSIVNEKIELKQAAMDEAVESLKTSDIFDPEEMINQKLAVRLLGREVEALQWVTELPKKLQEQGDTADELLGTIDESSD